MQSQRQRVREGGGREHASLSLPVQVTLVLFPCTGTEQCDLNNVGHSFCWCDFIVGLLKQSCLSPQSTHESQSQPPRDHSFCFCDLLVGLLFALAKGKGRSQTSARRRKAKRARRAQRVLRAQAAERGGLKLCAVECAAIVEPVHQHPPHTTCGFFEGACKTGEKLCVSETTVHTLCSLWHLSPPGRVHSFLFLYSILHS